MSAVQRRKIDGLHSQYNKSSMQQEYVRLLTKFYARMVEGSRQAQLLSHSLERFLSYELKEEEKMQRQREKQGSLRSGSSANSISDFEKVKRLFYSNNLETALLFYYCLTRIKTHQAQPLLRLLAQANDRLKALKTGPPTQERRRFATRVTKFSEAVQFLQGRAGEGRAVDWLYFQAFKEFEPEATLAVQLLGSSGETLESREGLRASQYGEALRIMRTTCSLFDYSTRESQVLGSEGQRLYIGRRSDTYFVLTEKEYERASSNNSVLGSRKQLQVRGEEGGVQSPPPNNRFKEEFLAEMVKLRQGYEANTATIASLFHFKDAGEGRTEDQINQA